MRTRWVAVAVTVGVLAAGCGGGARPTGSTRTSPGAATPPVSAALAPCPASGGAGGALPAVTMACLGTGPAVRLAGLRGPALVNLWAGWCRPCQREAPTLQRLYAASRGRLLVLGVLTDDDRADGLAAARGLALHYPSVVDTDAVLRRHLGIAGPPATLFVDANGRVVQTIRGATPALPRLRAMVARYLGVSV